MQKKPQMRTKHHQVQLLVQKDTFFGTGMQENEDSVQKDTFLGTGIGEWYSGGWQEKIPGWEMI